TTKKLCERGLTCDSLLFQMFPIHYPWGMKVAMKKAFKKLGLRYKEHITAYGESNERRLVGHHETADIYTFSW
ncbi:hypothetical protein L7F22_012101, partial [Adiantum nelumboides]|nr:hypothetical protein [Adiantum nelumboides]